MILRRRWQVSAGLVWSGLRVGEGRETHLAARRRHSCAMPRRSAALAGRRRAGSSAACRPRVLRRPMQAPTPLGSRRRSEAGLGQAAGVSGWGVSRLSSSPRLNFVLPRSGCSSRRRLPASLARCRRCRRRVPPRAVAERSVAGAGRVAPTAAAGEGSPRWARRGALQAHTVGAALRLSASLVSSSRSRGCRGCRVPFQRRRGARVRLGSLSSGTAVMGGGAWSCQTQPWPLEALSGLIWRPHGGGPAAPPSSLCDVVSGALLGGLQRLTFKVLDRWGLKPASSSGRRRLLDGAPGSEASGSCSYVGYLQSRANQGGGGGDESGVGAGRGLPGHPA